MPKRDLIDMDGILLIGTTLIPGADAFPACLREARAEYPVLSGVTGHGKVGSSAYRPTRVVPSLAEIES